MNNRHIILDRDGVINVDSDSFIKSPEEWHAIEGSIEAIAKLSRNGYQIIVITNQSGISRQLFSLATLDAMHQKMLNMVAQQGGQITAIYFCPHSPKDTCECRKPKPGLFFHARDIHSIDLSKTFAIGDSYRDLEAAITAGAKPILVKTGKGQTTLLEHPAITCPIFENLYDAADHIITES